MAGLALGAVVLTRRSDGGHRGIKGDEIRLASGDDSDVSDGVRSPGQIVHVLKVWSVCHIERLTLASDADAADESCTADGEDGSDAAQAEKKSFALVHGLSSAPLV